MLKYKINGNESGELIVFVNGAGVGPWMWERQLNYFKDYKCISFDLPGHGENSDRDFTTIEDCSRIIREIIENESSEGKGIAIGLSIGAQIVLHMISHHQDVLKKCVVISGLNKPMKLSKPSIRILVSCSMPFIKLKSFSKLQAKQLSLPKHMFEAYYTDSLKISKNSLVNILYENMKFSFGKMEQTTVDTLLLVGENEKKIMIDSARLTYSNMSNCIGYIVKKAAHGIPYEQADIFNVLVSNFFEGITTNISDAVIGNINLRRLQYEDT
ncbi:alpha/beta fold hydrolase [Alkaliphilus transvaalensis]|uniref:alpha/beta fold hydrolase n=1 Tax=Alkaliphilus transvaalensis TaxID=114628 RepID=UPI0004787EE2|nr:alpha/beta hydrolase [Alkaliphilus transvaalensis]